MLLFDLIRSWFKPKSVDSIVSDINQKISELTRLEGEKLVEADELQEQATQIRTKAIQASNEAARARAISLRLEGLVKFNVA